MPTIYSQFKIKSSTRQDLQSIYSGGNSASSLQVGLLFDKGSLFILIISPKSGIHSGMNRVSPTVGKSRMKTNKSPTKIGKNPKYIQHWRHLLKMHYSHPYHWFFLSYSRPLLRRVCLVLTVILISLLILAALGILTAVVVLSIYLSLSDNYLEKEEEIVFSAIWMEIHFSSKYEIIKMNPFLCNRGWLYERCTKHRFVFSLSLRSVKLILCSRFSHNKYMLWNLFDQSWKIDLNIGRDIKSFILSSHL